MHTMFNLTSNPELIIFDLDGTLAKAFSDELLPGVAEWFAYWRKYPTWAPKVAIATNQGGVAYRLHKLEAGAEDADKFPTKAMVDNRVYGIAAELGIDPNLIHISYAYQFSQGYWVDTPIQYVRDPRWAPNWRKPNPGMLQQALRDTETEPGKALMIGDQDSDREAAVAAGIPFQTAVQFFRFSVPVIA